MSTSTLPEAVQVLLEPIDPSSPLGEDLDTNDAPYALPEMAMSGMKPDYKACAKHSADILRKSSKHVQIVFWLILSWFKLSGINGFREGLQVMRELLKSHGMSVFPVSPVAKIKAIQGIGKNGTIKVLLKKVDITGSEETTQALQEVRVLLREIDGIYQEHTPELKKSLAESGEDRQALALGFEEVLALIDEKLSKAGATIATETAPPGEEYPPLPENLNDILVAELEKEVEGVSEEQDPTEEQDAGDEQSVPDEKTEENLEEPEEEEEIPWEVEELLEEIDNSPPVGEDVEFSSDQDAFAAFLGLQSEIQKPGGNDYTECVNTAKKILINYSKHLRVALYLTIAWYWTERLSGLKNGIVLITKILEGFEGKVHPIKEKDRKLIIQQLAKERRFSNLKRVSLGDEKAEFKVTDVSINSFGDSVSRKLRPLKGNTIYGRDVFRDALVDILEKEEVETHEKALISHFMDKKPGQENIRFAVNKSVLKQLKRAGLPEEMARQIDDEMMDKEYNGWARCFDNLDLALGSEQARTYRPILEPYLNKNIQDLLSIEQATKQLLVVCEDQFNNDPPRLSAFLDVVSELANRARQFRKEGKILLEEQLNQKKKAEQAATNRAKAQQKAREAQAARQSSGAGDGTGRASGPAAIGQVSIAQQPEAFQAVKMGLQFFFGEEEGAQELVMEPRVYALVREFRWGAIRVAPEDQTVEAPPEGWRNNMIKRAEALDNHVVIREIESAFLERRDILYWLDGQRLVVEAFEQLGEAGLAVAEEIKMSLAKFLQRFPQLDALYFKDKKADTPFASDLTKEWIKEHVSGMFGKGGAHSVLPPLLGEEYDDINEAYKIAREALPDGFDVHAEAIQKAIAIEPRRKGRFLIRLNLANYYAEAGQLGVARAMFNALIQDIIDFRIADWEPALCVSVWQSAYLNNIKLLKEEHFNEDSTIILQQNDLLKLISGFNGLLAIELINRTS